MKKRTKVFVITLLANILVLAAAATASAAPKWLVIFYQP